MKVYYDADADLGLVKSKKIAVLGVTFKPNTDDMRDAPSLVIVPSLQADGAEVVLCDPEGRREGEPLLPDADWVADPYQAAKGADALVIITEWNQFRALDLQRIWASMNNPMMVDLRNVYRPEEAAEAGLTYHSIGRKSAAPAGEAAS